MLCVFAQCFFFLIFGMVTFLGIELVLGTRVKSADVRRKTLVTATGETISYKILIIATGARVLNAIFISLKTFCFLH